MAKDKKLVEAITSMDVDFAQWYTDVVKKGLYGHQTGRLCDLGEYPEGTGRKI